MGRYVVCAEVDSKKLTEILDALEEAKNTIYRCYSELQDLEVITVREKNDTANED